MAEYGQGLVNQTQVNLDVATVELTTLVETSTSISPATYYCNYPANTFSSILAQVMETDAQIVLSSGTFSEPSLIDLSANVGLALVAPAVFPPITQFDFSLQASAANIRLSHLEIYGTFVIKSTNSSVSHCLFEDTVNVRQCNRDIYFDSCEFRSPITVEVSFAASGDAIIPVVTFNNCDFRGTSFVLNQTYPYQVVFRGCRNFANFSATNARYIGINTLTNGNTIRNNITELAINGETKIENYVYTAGASGEPDYWSSVLNNPATTDLNLAGNSIINVSQIDSSSNLFITTNNDEGQLFIQANGTQQGEGISSRINISQVAVNIGSFIGAGQTDYRGMSLSSANNLTFENGTQNISNLAGTTTSQNFTLTDGSGGVLTFEDGTTQATAVVIPTNTVTNNMLIATDTGVLSWTASPVSSTTYYCNQNSTDLGTVISQMGANAGSQIIMSSGSFDGSAVSLVYDNQAIVGANCSPAITELNRAVTVSGARMRLSNLQIDGLATLTGNACVYSYCDFVQNVVIGSNTNSRYITVANCEFVSGKTITINALGNTEPVYFINCNFGGATVVVNTSSPLQCIFNNCAGFTALPLTTKATLVGLNVLASGVINSSVQRTILASGRGTAGQCLLSGGASANDTWGSAPNDPLKYDVSGGNITGNVTLSATKSITADIINIKTLNIGSPQYITASTGVINATASITKLSPTLNTSQAVTIANGTVDGFVKFIEIIDSNATSITITGANLHSTISFTNSVGAGGQGAILVWDNDSEFWIVTALNNGATGGGGGVSSITAGSYIDVSNNIPSAPVVSLALPTCDTTGKVLSSTTAGVLSWVAQGGGGSFMAINNGAGTGATTLQGLVITPDAFTRPVLKLLSTGGDTVLETGGSPVGNMLQLMNGKVEFNFERPIYSRDGYAVSNQYGQAFGIAGTLAPITLQNCSNENNSPFPVATASSFGTWNIINWNYQPTPTLANYIEVNRTNNGNTLAFAIYSPFPVGIKISWSSSVYGAGKSKTRLHNITSSEYVSSGTTTQDANNNTLQNSTGIWYGLVSNGTNIEIEHFTETGNSSGMGGSSYISSSEPNVNAYLTIEVVGGQTYQ